MKATFGTRLKAERKRKKLSIMDLQWKSGVDSQSIRIYEKPKWSGNLNASTAHALAEALGTTVKFLLTGKA